MKSFINSTSVKTNVSMSSKENSTLRSKEPPMTMLSREHSRLPRENSMPPREHSFHSNEKTPGKLKSREKSTARKHLSSVLTVKLNITNITFKLHVFGLRISSKVK